MGQDFSKERKGRAQQGDICKPLVITLAADMYVPKNASGKFEIKRDCTE